MAGGTHLLCTAVGATIGPMAEVIVVSTCGTTKTALAFSSGLTDVATKATGLQGGSTDLAGCATKRAARGWQKGALAGSRWFGRAGARKPKPGMKWPTWLATVGAD